MSLVPIIPESEIPDRAKALAWRFESITAQAPHWVPGLAAGYGIDPERTGLVPRLCDQYFMRRHLRRAVARVEETGQREAGAVGGRRAAYVSNTAMRRQLDRHARTKRLLASMVAECVAGPDGVGYSATLAEMAETSLSNPRIRRAEMMVRIKGAQELAEQAGLCGLFLTWTLPSKYHATHATGEPVANFNGATPKDGQRRLCDQWARFRAACKKSSIEMMGLRVAEPHQDGTPHWHLLIWCKRGQRGRLVRLARRYARAEDKHEAGAWRARFKVVPIDPERGAVGYVSAYVSKNIDGKTEQETAFGDGLDYEAQLSAVDGAARATAWARVWGIRQFQFFGMPAVTVWREARRLEPGAETSHANQIVEAATGNDWAGFCRLMRASVAGTLYRATENKYGEPAQQIAGVVFPGAGPVITRVREWIIRLGKDTNAAGRAVDLVLASAKRAQPWTRINNCNPADYGGWEEGEILPFLTPESAEDLDQLDMMGRADRIEMWVATHSETWLKAVRAKRRAEFLNGKPARGRLAELRGRAAALRVSGGAQGWAAIWQEITQVEAMICTR